MKVRNALLAGVLVLAAGGVSSGLTAGGLRSAHAAPVQKPNIIFVLTDDMRPDEMTMTANMRPNGGFDWIRDHGVRFSKYISTDNLCCPGRTTALTGKTSYNHGVQTNENRHTNLQKDSLPIYLSNAGYCTGFTGKYHINNPRVRPGGWTFWEPTVGEGDGYGMLRRNGTVFHPDVYQTDYLADVASRQLHDCRAAGKPAALALWPAAPHQGFEPDKKYAKTPIKLIKRDPSFNEADVSDKPAWLRKWFRTTKPASYWNPIRSTRVRTLLSVDDALKRLISELQASGELSNTLLVLSADNGFLLGEHRVRNRKRLAYEAAQPGLWLAGPGFPAGVVSDAFATNLDLVPTMLKTAGGTIPWSKLDGRALQDVIREPDHGHDRFLPIHVPIETADAKYQPVGHGVRTWRYKYIKYADGSQELYDLAHDPYELRNVVNDARYRSVATAMRSLQPKARACKAATCRSSAPAALQ
jgi:N-acetylglucosamine-6-sulfatase